MGLGAERETDRQKERGEITERERQTNRQREGEERERGGFIYLCRLSIGQSTAWGHLRAFH